MISSIPFLSSRGSEGKVSSWKQWEKDVKQQKRFLKVEGERIDCDEKSSSFNI